MDESPPSLLLGALRPEMRVRGNCIRTAADLDEGYLKGASSLSPPFVVFMKNLS